MKKKSIIFAALVFSVFVGTHSPSAKLATSCADFVTGESNKKLMFEKAERLGKKSFGRVVYSVYGCRFVFKQEKNGNITIIDQHQVSSKLGEVPQSEQIAARSDIPSKEVSVETTNSNLQNQSVALSTQEMSQNDTIESTQNNEPLSEKNQNSQPRLAPNIQNAKNQLQALTNDPAQFAQLCNSFGGGPVSAQQNPNQSTMRVTGRQVDQQQARYNCTIENKNAAALSKIIECKTQPEMIQTRNGKQYCVFSDDYGNEVAIRLGAGEVQGNAQTLQQECSKRNGSLINQNTCESRTLIGRRECAKYRGNTKSKPGFCLLPKTFKNQPFTLKMKLKSKPKGK